MSLFAQGLLDVHDKLIVDLFAGGGGASSGIEQALGRMVDVAVNHNAQAVSLHEANHPQTRHYVTDVFEINPLEITLGRPVGLLWASPDCTYHSKARGSKPIRSKSKRRRALAWVVTRWAGQARPDVIMLENVEEFAQWGPLIGKPDELRPCPKRKGKTFRRWVRSLVDLGYQVEWRELRACDYGAPTIRKRLFLIARCDGKPIVWPEATHGPGKPKPYRAVAECIDWSIPMLSIFATKDEAKEWGKQHGQSAPVRPLAENTLRRIARGVKKYVLENPKPYLVYVAHGEQSAKGQRWGKGDRSLGDPSSTITATNDLALVAPYLVPRYGEREGQEPRSRSVEEPSPVIVPGGNGGSLVAANLATYYGGEGGPERGSSLDEPLRTQSTENRHSLVMTFLTQNNGGYYEGAGHEAGAPLSTLTANGGGHHGLTVATLAKLRGTSVDADPAEPLGTVSAGGTHHALALAHLTTNTTGHSGANADHPAPTITTGGHHSLVASFLSKFYGTGIGQGVDEPAHTIPTIDRFGFVTVEVKKETHYIEDISMRMLQPRELYLAQGFRKGYIIDRDASGRTITKSEQVRMAGNSVCPPVAEALARANVAEMTARTVKVKVA